MATDVRAALAENRLRLEAQMIVPFVDDGHAKPHYELLLRMLDPEGNTIGPDRFLSAALRYQMMPTIDRWVISHRHRAAAAAPQLLANAPVVFTINFSGQSLTDEEFRGLRDPQHRDQPHQPGGVLLRAHRKRRGRQHERCAGADVAPAQTRLRRGAR